MKNRIFSTDSPKAIKASAYGYLNAIQYMAPHQLSGYRLCFNDTKGCRSLCLGRWSGTATYYDSVNKSRIAKARRYMEDRINYLRDVERAIRAVERKAMKLSLKVCIRLNGSTDIPWEDVKLDGKTLFDHFPHLPFCDYTKDYWRMYKERPANYHLCFSRSETNEAECRQLLADGFTVSVVSSLPRPPTWHGYPTIDGDAHDLRHLDPPGVVVWLSPKGNKAKRDKTGFVVRDYAEAA